MGIKLPNPSLSLSLSLSLSFVLVICYKSSLTGQFNKAQGHTQIGLLYHLSLGAITP